MDTEKLIERLREHFYELPNGYYDDSDYGCDWDDPHSLIMAYLDSGPEGERLLRTLSAGGYSIVCTEVVTEASDRLQSQQAEIAALQAQVERLKEALEPFANKAIHRDARRLPDTQGELFYFTYGDLRRARTALATHKETNRDEG